MNQETYFSDPELLKVAASAGLGLLAGLFLQWWKSARDERRALSDEVCKSVRNLVDTASDYWLETDSKVQQSQGARLLGQQTELAGIISIYIEQLASADRQKLRTGLKRLIMVATGDFGDRDDTAKIQFANGAHTIGAELITTVRQSLINRNSILGTISARLGW